VRILKAVVVLMSVLILAGIAVIVAELVKRAGPRTADPPAATALAEDPAPAVETTIPLPSGAAVTGLAATADRVILRIAEPGKPDRLLFLDPRTAAVRATVTLGAAP
jgi:hypothetical protein